MNPFFYTLISTAFISTLSLSGSILLFFKERIVQKISLFLVALAAAALLGTAFLHILPEVLEEELPEHAFLVPLLGFVIFYIAEKLLHLHHATQRQQEHGPRELGILSLSGDFMHNFVDGVILAAAFLVDVKLGMVTTAAVAFHEVPQEIAEFGVLLYAGFSKVKALVLNFLSATSIIIGGIAGFLAQDLLLPWIPLVLLFAVGSFLYIGASDFVPEFKKERNPKKALGLSLVFFAGLAFMWLLTLVE
ncbi:MAG: ZIP family metal transporter [bacterium]|nr:ZIP family metal transporter [bacterium]